jgi:ribosomal protein S18 acetylase RimI-like enzyme
MSVEIKEVLSKSDLKKFIKFPISLYKNNDCFVPPLISDEITTLTKGKNPSLDYCQLRMWLAYEGSQIVGRIAGIIQGKEIEVKKLIRFGWIDFIDDQAVSKALIQTVEDWAKAEGLHGIHGPLGFTDMDFEGMLIEGFDEMATIATIYNFPYYVDHMNALGFEKAEDWLELEIPVPEVFPEKTQRVLDLIANKYEVRVVPFKSAKDMLPYTDKLFKTLNRSFKELYGFNELTQDEIDYYIKQYFDFVVPGFVIMVADKNDDIVGFTVTMPSLSKAFRKANGSLFPFGFLHVLKAVKFNKMADLYLIGTSPEFQNKGVANIVIGELLKTYKKHGITTAYTNQMLESNTSVLNQMMRYSSKIRKRRRCFIKEIA